MKKLILIIILFAYTANAQKLSLFNIDSSNFPNIKAKFRLFDNDFNQIKNPNINDFIISENGKIRKITNISCPTPQAATNLSSVITIDVSESMNIKNNGISNMDLAKAAANFWVDALPTASSQAAITAFDSQDYLYQDFTNDKLLLHKAIDKLQTNGGTNYTEAFLGNYAGSIKVMSKAKYKKVVVFLSDGLPSENPELTNILSQAKVNNIIIFNVTLGIPCPQSLKDISKQTGGEWFENITTIDQAKQVYSTIMQIVNGNEACDLSWESGLNCNNNFIDVNFSWKNTETKSNYLAPNNSLMTLEINPNFIAFGKQLPKTINDTIINLKAINSDFNVTNIKVLYGNSSFSITNTQFPIYIAKNTSKSISLRFEPLDSSMVYTAFEIETDQCPNYFSANGGFAGIQTQKTTLKITKPNGNEKFVVGSDTLIQWEGIAKSDVVTLEYSINDGTDWKQLTNKASGLEYNWKNIPKPTSNQCLARIKQYNNLNNIGDSVLDLKGHTSSVRGAAYSPDGSKVATSSYDGTVKIWDAFTGKLLNTLVGHSNWVLGVAFSPDGSKVGSASQDGTAKVWDTYTGKLLNTFTGHNGWVVGVAFSPDGTQLATGSFDYTAKIWDIQSGQIIKTLTGLPLEGYAVSFSPDGSHLAIGCANFRVYVFDIGSGKVSNRLSAHNSNVWSVAFGPDGKKLVSASLDGTAKIWDVQNEKVLFTLQGHTAPLYAVAYSKDGSKILTGSNDKTAKIWDANTGKLLNTLVGHKEYIWSVAISPDAKKFLTAGSDGISKIWGIENQPLQSDISDNTFSIVAPEVEARDINMGKTIVNVSKDSLIQNYIINIGDYKSQIRNIYFESNDFDQFQVVSGLPVYDLDAKSSHNLEIRFKPKSLGMKNTKIVIVTQSDTLKYNVKGEAFAPLLAVINKNVDFGKVKIGTNKDTMDVFTIQNISNSTIEFTKTKHNLPNDIDFSTINNGGPFTLAPNEIRKMSLKFKPSAKGRTNGILEFHYNGLGSPAIVSLFGEGISPDLDCEGSNFVYKNFENLNNLNLGASAIQTNEKTIRLTESKFNDIGAVSYNERVSVRNNFTMKLSFRFSKGDNYLFIDGSLPGADGIALLFQNGKNFRTTKKGGSLGYHGNTNCIALEVDMYRNNIEYNDPNGNHVALQVPYNDTVSSYHDANHTVKMNENIFEIKPDSTIYYGMLNYDYYKKHLDFYLDSNKNTTNLVLSVDNFDFAQYLKLEKGDFAYIGITSTTGASSEIHEILSWEFCSDRDEFLGVEDEYYQSEEIVQNENILSLDNAIIKHIRVMDYVGKMLINEEKDDNSLDLSRYNLSNGIYFVFLTDDQNRNYYKKIVLSR